MITEIGSEFEHPTHDQLDAGGHLAQWISPGKQAVTGGRQALGLVAARLVAEGRRGVLVPDHYCESMTDPFTRHGLGVVAVPTTNDCLLDPDALDSSLTAHTGYAVLHSETFGTPANPDLTSALDRARIGDHPVVVDRTHSLLAVPSWHGEYEVASLRKLLPTPDGAWVSGIERTLTDDPVAAEFVRLRSLAARAKRDDLAGLRADKAHLEQFGLAEELLDHVSDTAAISSTAVALLDQLDPERIRDARLRNATHVAARLAEFDVEVANPRGWKHSPCYVVIRVPEAAALRRALVKESVYCPIHWPRPTQLGTSHNWRDDLLSLVVDQRYTLDDMDRLLTAVGRMLTRQ
jgi:hypothetical protein